MLQSNLVPSPLLLSVLIIVVYAGSQKSLQAIEGYRETEKAVWEETTAPVVHRLKEAAEEAGGEGVRALDEVHILDLANDG